VARHFRDLVCWQLAYQLKCEVFKFAATVQAARQRTVLRDCRDCAYLSDALYFRLMNLSRAALKATTNYMRSKQRDAGTGPI